MAKEKRSTTDRFMRDAYKRNLHELDQQLADYAAAIDALSKELQHVATERDVHEEVTTLCNAAGQVVAVYRETTTGVERYDVVKDVPDAPPAVQHGYLNATSPWAEIPANDVDNVHPNHSMATQSAAVQRGYLMGRVPDCDFAEPADPVTQSSTLTGRVIPIVENLTRTLSTIRRGAPRAAARRP